MHRGEAGDKVKETKVEAPPEEGCPGSWRGLRREAEMPRGGAERACREPDEPGDQSQEKAASPANSHF